MALGNSLVCNNTDDPISQSGYNVVNTTRGNSTPLGVTRNWIRYRLPKRLIRSGTHPVCIGQKQKWFLLRLTCDDKDVDVLHSSHPEFDDWRWTSYWYPIRNVVSFKREVYRRALKELLPMLFNGLRSQQKPEQKSNNKPDHKKHSRRHKARRRKNPNQ